MYDTNELANSEFTTSFIADDVEKQEKRSDSWVQINGVFSDSYNCRDEEDTKGLARGQLDDKKYTLDPGEALDIYMEKNEKNIELIR